MSIKRFQFFTEGFDNYSMRERPDGEFVKVEDVVDAIRAYTEEHGKKVEWDREGAYLDAVCWRIVDLIRGEAKV